MNEQALLVLDQITKNRTKTRKSAFAFGFTAVGAPIFFILSSLASRGAAGSSNVLMFIGLLPALATPTILGLAFTFLPMALGLKSRAAALKQIIETDGDLSPVVSSLNKDAKALRILGIALLSLALIAGAIFLATMNLRVSAPLQPGECCLNSDGTSPNSTASPWTVMSGSLLVVCGPYWLVMGVIALIASVKTKKIAKQLVALTSR